MIFSPHEIPTFFLPLSATLFYFLPRKVPCTISTPPFPDTMLILSKKLAYSPEWQNCVNNLSWLFILRNATMTTIAKSSKYNTFKSRRSNIPTYARLTGQYKSSRKTCRYPFSNCSPRHVEQQRDDILQVYSTPGADIITIPKTLILDTVTSFTYILVSRTTPRYNG